MKLKLLNNTQQEQLTRMLGFYKHFWICNACGSVYGSDFLEIKDPLCPACELEVLRENKSKRKKK